MPQLATNCPRCRASNVAFEVRAVHFIGILRYNWQHWYDLFCICSHCDKTTTFIVAEKNHGVAENYSAVLKPNSTNSVVDVEDYRSLKDEAADEPPDHIPEQIAQVFKEGATCLAVKCYNASGVMFRMCVDLATKELLPDPPPASLTKHIARNLTPRIEWLLDNTLLPEALRELSTCIKDDGNDGAHDGTLTKVEAEDLLDFTVALLERLYTEPERLKIAAQRRHARRNP